MNACIPALFLVLGLSAAARAQDVPVFWEKDLALAIERARRLQRPILAALHAPGNEESETFLDKTYKAVELRKLLREYVCVVGTAKPFPEILEGERKGMSSVFMTVSFEEAKKVEQELRKRYLGSEEVTIPQHLILNSLGQLVNQKEGALDAKALAAFLTKGLDRVSPGWSPESKILPVHLLFTGTAAEQGRVLDQFFASDGQDALLELYPRIEDEATKVLLLSKIRFADGDLKWQEPILLAALDDKSPTVRAHAAVNATGLGLAGLAKALLRVAKMEKVADDATGKEVEVLSELIAALATCGKKHRTTRKWLFLLEKHRNPEIRSVFYVSMASWAKDRKEKKLRSLLLSEGLLDAEWDVRCAAIWSLAEMRSKKSVAVIKRMLARERTEWRQEFFSLALARIRGKAPDPDVWEAARLRLSGENIPRPWSAAKEAPAK
jgi:hypothetical protein